MNKTEQILENNRDSDFSGGPVVKKPPGQCRAHRFTPWSRKIPYVLGQGSPCTTATEPVP